MKKRFSTLACLRFTMLVLAVCAVPTVFAQEIMDPPRRPRNIETNAQTANFIAMSTGSGTTVTDSIMFEDVVNSRIGVNTTVPKNTFHVFAGATSDVFMGIGPDPGPTGPAMNFGYSGSSGGRGSGFFNVRPDASAVAPNPSLRFMTLNVMRMIITNAGKIGINTIPSGASTNILEVNGNANFIGTVTGTNIAATYQDVAEWVPASEDLAPGTVVVIDPSKSNAVIPSAQSYDTTVAGIVSKQPGLILGERGADMEAIATTGRVKVRVDARNAPIRIGDLLVTSDVAGTAMKSEPLNFKGRRMHQPGTIIGKALEPLDKGVGEILVLLSLQ
jgi:hypothetical protein